MLDMMCAAHVVTIFEDSEQMDKRLFLLSVNIIYCY